MSGRDRGSRIQWQPILKGFLPGGLVGLAALWYFSGRQGSQAPPVAPAVVQPGAAAPRVRSVGTPAVRPLSKRRAASTALPAVAAAPTGGPPGYRRISETEAEDLLGALSLDQKIGQMLMIGFRGTSAAPVRRFFRRRPVGGVIFYRENLRQQKQVRKLTAELQELSVKANGGIGLLLSTDEEGGKIWRLPRSWLPGGALPSAEEMGAADVQVTRDAAERTAEALQAVGLNMNLAPVLDVLTNPANPIMSRGRCFGSTPEVVAEHGSAYIESLQAKGVVATAKHFPGHGPTSKDSHKELPLVVLPFEQWRHDHYEPYYSAIHVAGVEAVMTAHVAYQFRDYATALDGNMPASLSPYFTAQVLRNHLGFRGIIVTDNLEMGAIRKNFRWPAAALRAIDAGVDLILISNGEEQQARAFDAIKNAVQAGKLSPDRIDDSVRRILRVKARHGLILASS